MPSASRVRTTRRATSPRLATRTEPNMASGAESAGAHHLLHLVRALADGEDLRVPVHAADRILLDVAVAAVDLHGLLGAAHREAAGLELGLGGGQREVAAGVLQPRGLVDEQARGL